MSTGSVAPFTPSAPTQLLNVGSVSATLSFIPGDVLMLQNAGSVTVFVTLGATSQTLAATVPAGGTPGSFPILAGDNMLVGTPGVVGNQADQITQIGAIVSSGTAELYVTPGLGTGY
jgi:hypothetical protein